MSKPPADLRVYWSRRERALVYNGSKPTGGMTAHHFESTPLARGRSFAKELEERGYDLTTLRFQIRKKAT
jgi:hypothetical protein